MKRFRPEPAVFLIVLVLFVGIVLGTNISSGQSTAAKKRVTQPAANPAGSQPQTEPPLKPSTISSAFKLAATRNAELSKTLNWTFGGKQQTGWFLYRPLIGKLLGTESDATTEHFAIALSRWQSKSGLPATGILDEDTINAMISRWQDLRLKDRSFPQPDKLIVVPAAEFYDPSRPDELRQVERETYAAYRRMIAAAARDRSLDLRLGVDGKLAPNEKYLKLVSTYRSREYQEKLRRETPAAGRAGLALNSPHFTGRALDLYVGGDPVETKDSNRAIQVQTPVYKWLVRNAERFGFQPYFYEPWHWEYVKG